jgi:class 3 adenylate cyclase/tetratricopeptide (TPR) repeat protein/ribosomal protein L40E
MRCPSCNYENPADASFCEGCGAKLELICPACKASVSPGARFCRKCGTAVGPTKAAVSTAVSSPKSQVIVVPDGAAPEAIEGERKTVTALFADIKGSMELMEDLDPEEARAIIDPALHLMIEAARRYDGYIVQSTGDGIFALFGAPVAHEDHPQRAVYAALRLQEAIRKYSSKLVADGGTPLEARVGINTGEVVVRTLTTADGHAEYTPIGHTANLASRMQAIAPTGSISITEHTRRLVEGYFQLKSRGPTRVKGLAEPINVYEVSGLGPLRTRLQRAAGRGLTKFVGREREMETLRHAAERAKGGRGQLVAVMAEPGVGKSRLFYEFRMRSQLGWMVLETFSVSHGKASPYLPVIELLRGYFGIDANDDARKRREKVNGRIVTLDPALEDTRPYLFALLGLVEGEDPLAQMDAQIRRRRTLDAIKRILLRESLNQPLILIFEDLHWIDEETQAFLNLFVEGLANAPVLMLVNYRPEYSHAWGSKTYYTQLRLDPLGKDSADEMLTALVSDAPELAPLKRLVLERTEGNPLFVEELIQALFDEGALARNGTVKLSGPLSQLKIPPTVQGILASRIDRLPPDEKELLQTLAVIGTELPLSLVRQVVPLQPPQLERLLSGLQSREFIYEQPAAGDVEYTFKHALTHDVAYNSLLAEHRKALHERTAQAIEELFSERLEDHLTELAHHFDRSGNVPKAVEYLGGSGAKAGHQGAHSEAIGCFTRALELLRQLPENAVRDHRELDLQMALSWSLFIAGGLRAAEREQALLRARELCEHLGENDRLMESLVALAHFRFNQGDFGPARALAESVIAMDRPGKASTILAGARFAVGLVAFAGGEFLTAREHLERAVALFSDRQSQSQEYGLYAQVAPNVLAGAYGILGYPSYARERTHELLAAARRSSDPYSTAFALLGHGMHYVMFRDPHLVAERADEMHSIATEHQISLLLILSQFFGGWVMAAAGRIDEGIAKMQRSLSNPMVTRASSAAIMLGFLVDTCARNGRAEAGLDLVAKGLATADQFGIRVAEAELHRLKGELLLIKDPLNMAEAEGCLRIAIDIARRQGAKLFELRATLSLARLLDVTNRRGEARAMLAEIYGWFTEGFDTADLKDAKALLEELSSV